MRVYLPLTMASLAAALEGDAVDAGPGFAVTPALREAHDGDDVEELEYEASRAAAAAALALVHERGDALRRVVLAVEAPDAAVRPLPGGVPAAVDVAVPVPWADVESALVDAPDVDADGIEDEQLGWYAVQELSALVQRT